MYDFRQSERTIISHDLIKRKDVSGPPSRLRLDPLILTLIHDTQAKSSIGSEVLNVELRAIADFLFEVGMLKRTPRSGFQFLGTGKETVAEHSLRTAIIGYVLARMSGNLSTERVVFMCLFHDLVEARTGDLNYVNKKYVKADEALAVRDMTAGLPFGEEIRGLAEEFNERASAEALAAHDADQIEMILQLKELGDLGNRYAPDWISAAMKRLRTDQGKRLARSILNTDFAAWWFKEKENEWWVNADRSD
jgi:putative hydrolases of HD superfamily